MPEFAPHPPDEMLALPPAPQDREPAERLQEEDDRFVIEYEPTGHVDADGVMETREVRVPAGPEDVTEPSPTDGAPREKSYHVTATEIPQTSQTWQEGRPRTDASDALFRAMRNMAVSNTNYAARRTERERARSDLFKPTTPTSEAQPSGTFISDTESSPNRERLRTRSQSMVSMIGRGIARVRAAVSEGRPNTGHIGPEQTEQREGTGRIRRLGRFVARVAGRGPNTAILPEMPADAVEQAAAAAQAAAEAESTRQQQAAEQAARVEQAQVVHTVMAEERRETQKTAAEEKKKKGKVIFSTKRAAPGTTTPRSLQTHLDESLPRAA